MIRSRTRPGSFVSIFLCESEPREDPARTSGMHKAFLAFAALLPVAASAASSPPLGLWARGDGKAIVLISLCGSSICATNTWIKPGVEDEKVGDRLILKVAPVGASSFVGEAYDPQRNLNFKFQMEATSQAMTTRGCMLAGLLCKSMNWTRHQAAQ
jgi:uncharacterized protein (DUF2147 family)